MIIIHFGAEGGSSRVNDYFLIFCYRKIVFRQKSFYRDGALLGPGGTLVSRKLRIFWLTLCAVRPTFHVVQPTFGVSNTHSPPLKRFSKCFGLFKGKRYTFPKSAKIGLVAEKLMRTFRVNHDSFFYFLTLP